MEDITRETPSSRPGDSCEGCFARDNDRAVDIMDAAPHCKYPTDGTHEHLETSGDCSKFQAEQTKVETCGGEKAISQLTEAGRGSPCSTDEERYVPVYAKNAERDEEITHGASLRCTSAGRTVTDSSSRLLLYIVSAHSHRGGPQHSHALLGASSRAVLGGAETTFVSPGLCEGDRRAQTAEGGPE